MRIKYHPLTDIDIRYHRPRSSFLCLSYWSITLVRSLRPKLPLKSAHKPSINPEPYQFLLSESHQASRKLLISFWKHGKNRLSFAIALSPLHYKLGHSCRDCWHKIYQKFLQIHNLSSAMRAVSLSLCPINSTKPPATGCHSLVREPLQGPIRKVIRDQAEEVQEPEAQRVWGNCRLLRWDGWHCGPAQQVGSGAEPHGSGQGSGLSVAHEQRWDMG